MRRQQQRSGAVKTSGLMRYVICPNCGDPVAGRLTPQLTCTHCKESFLFDELQALTGVVSYDEHKDRWIEG
jgi:transcription elongation factor Elf1